MKRMMKGKRVAKGDSEKSKKSVNLDGLTGKGKKAREKRLSGKPM